MTSLRLRHFGHPSVAAQKKREQPAAHRVLGGCLEGDLIEHAKRVFRDGQARIVAYDLRGDKGEFWGLDIGCNGLTRLLLQLIAAENDYRPISEIITFLSLQFIRGCLSGRRASKLLTIARRTSIDPSAVLTRFCRRSQTRAHCGTQSHTHRASSMVAQYRRCDRCLHHCRRFWF